MELFVHFEILYLTNFGTIKGKENQQLYDASFQIKSLINKVNKSNIKIADLRKKKEWEEISNCGDKRFPNLLKTFLDKNKIHIQFVCINLNFVFKSLSSTYENIIEFDDIVPCLVISSDKITNSNFSNKIGNKFLSLHWLTSTSKNGKFLPILRSQNYSIKEFNFDNFPILPNKFKDKFTDFRINEINKYKSVEKVNDTKVYSKNKKDFNWLGLFKLLFFGNLYKVGWVSLIVIVSFIYYMNSDYVPSKTKNLNITNKERFKNELRDEAVKLYENCKTFGKSFDSRC